jgi:hypothetical protein
MTISKGSSVSGRAAIYVNGILEGARPVDGASFIYDPACPDPIQGVTQDPNDTEPTTLRFSNKKYAFLRTDFPTPAGGIYSYLVVTVMYDPKDIDDTGPNIVYGPDDAPYASGRGNPHNRDLVLQGSTDFFPPTFQCRRPCRLS